MPQAASGSACPRSSPGHPAAERHGGRAAWALQPIWGALGGQESGGCQQTPRDLEGVDATVPRHPFPALGCPAVLWQGVGGVGVGLQPWGRRRGRAWGQARLPAGCGRRCACGASRHGNGAAASPPRSLSRLSRFRAPSPAAPSQRWAAGPRRPCPPIAHPAGPPPRRPPSAPRPDPPAPGPPPAPWRGRTPDGGRPRAGGDAAGHGPGRCPRQP